MKSINEALSYVQRKLKAPKTQVNKFGGYSYRTCEDILTGLKGAMPENASVTLSDDVVCVSDRVYIVATASFRFLGEEISVKGWAREALNQKGMADAQLTGSSSSYARKYALNGLFAIDDSKDIDAGEPGKPKDGGKTEEEIMDITSNVATCFIRNDWVSAAKILSSLSSADKSRFWVGLSGPARIWIQSNSKGR